MRPVRPPIGLRLGGEAVPLQELILPQGLDGDGSGVRRGRITLPNGRLEWDISPEPPVQEPPR